MADQDYLSYLFPLAAFGGTLAASMNNPDAGQRLGSMAIQGLNYLNTRDTQERYMRQQELTELLRVGAEAAKLGQVQAVAPIEARLKELGFVGGLLPVAQEQALRYQQANAEFNALESGLTGAHGEGTIPMPPAVPGQPPYMVPPAPMAGPSQAPMPAQEAMPQTTPQPTSDAEQSRQQEPLYQPLNVASANNLRQHVWELDDQIAQAAPGSDERGALIDKMLSATNELQNYEKVRTANQIPEGIDQEALSAELSALKHGKLPLGAVDEPTPAPESASQSEQAAPQQTLELPPPFEAAPAPALLPIPGGTINRAHPAGHRSISISRGDRIEQNKELASRYYMGQVNGGIPPAMALARLEQQGFMGDLTKDLWSDAWRRSYSDLVTRFTMQGDPVAQYRAFQGASLMTGGRGIPQEMVSTVGKFPDVNEIRLRDAMLPKMGGIPPFTGEVPQAPQSAGGLSAYDQAEKKRLVDLAGAEAGQRQRATDEAKLDAPLDIETGGRAGYARLKAGGMGAIEKPDESVKTIREAKAQGYVNVNQYHKDLASARDVGNVLVQISDMRKYMDAIVKANPGAQTLTQGVSNFFNSLTGSGTPTGIMAPDGSRALTTGEVVALYNGEKNALMNRVARSIGGTVGTQTEGDIFREIREWPGLTDTAAVKDVKLYDLQKKVFNEQQSLLRGVFGQDAVNKAYQNVDMSRGPAGPPAPVLPGQASNAPRMPMSLPSLPPVPRHAPLDIPVAPMTPIAPQAAPSAPPQPRKRDALDSIIERALAR